MEAVPKLPMLVFDLRTSEGTVEYSSTLKKYIREHYGEDPTLFEGPINVMESMRNQAVYPRRTVKGVSLLKRYYCQLQYMSSRFPMKKNEEAAVSYSWRSLHSKQVFTEQDITLELASILYNIGALHVELGAMENRSKSEGMKIACTHFQCAAWPFQVIIDEFPFSKNLGMSKGFMSFLAQVCLAQAQECILEKSMLDNRKSAITAKVAVQVVEFYKHSVVLLNEWPKEEDNVSEIVNSKNYKKWNKYLQFKSVYYESISLLYQGQQAEDQQKMGERVAFYQAAFDKIEEAAKCFTSLENPEGVVNEALTFVRDVIEVKRRAAKNENEFIYHEDVPLITHLPKLKGASLVKGIPFDINDPEVCDVDLFGEIVPMKAHESSSLYSEEKAKLLRRINGQIESKDEELETFLSMLDLDEIKSRDGNKLPQELIDRCASLSAKPDALTNLTEAMNKLANIYHDVESMLTEIKELLKEEENHEKEYQQMVGKRPPTIAATDLTREAKKYQEAHMKASESNQTLYKAMVMHLSNFKLLTLPLKELVNHIPVVSGDAETETITKEMLHLISKVDEMKHQRVMLADQLRDMACKDDITKRVVTYSGPKLEDLFQQELKKYDKLVSLIEQNLAAQENILKALKETYSRYGSTRKNTAELQRKRASTISSLITSYDAYDDLIAKSSKGLDFYKKLETNVSKLLQRVRGTCKVQEEEREQMLKSVRKSDSVTPQVDTSSSTLKLKDYLNIKKETGKLSLEPSSNMASVNSYYNDPTLVQQNWIPGVRPAPVGSEETDTTFKGPSDSFRGFYQGPGKDQIWSNTFYSAPQSAEQKLKFNVPPNPGAYQGLPSNVASQQNQDIYPISSYSTTLPKVEGQVYEPKSNYFDVHGSPNRCYNPSPSYPETVPDPSTGTVSSYAPPEVAYTQPLPLYNQNSVETPSYYNYNSPVPGNYSAVQSSTSQQSLTSYPPPNVQSEATTNVYGSSVQPQTAVGLNQPSTFDNSTTFSQTPLPYSSAPGQIPYTSAVGSYASPQLPSSTPNYVPPATDPSYVSSTTSNYQSYQPMSPKPPLPAGYQVNFSTHDPMQNYQNIQSVQTYPTPTTNPVAYLSTGQNPYSFGQTDNFYVGSQISETPSTQFTAECPSVGVPQSWATSYNSSLQSQPYFQSGNESLYTASQNPNTYTMTNSDMYKNTEAQGVNYSTDSNYGSHYYTNQYGQNYGGQTEMNSQNGNPVTYMQAGTEKQKAVTTTTFSNFEAKSSPVTNPSNVDLLAGLDFNISHSPLTPETTTTPKKEEPSHAEDLPRKSKTQPKTSIENSQDLNLVKDSNSEKIVPKDLMANIENAQMFAQDVEKYEKFVEGLTSKTLNGPTPLDLKWKEIVDLQEKISPLHIISVARCYPMKNRFPDILPYDDSRVELPSTKDDYINASRMMDLTKFTPPFILTQAPLPSTYGDFWAMVFEQQVEVVVCLLSDTELDSHVYYPSEKGQELEMGKLKISLQSSNVRPHWIERILSICVMETRATRVVVHLQFTAWPGSSFPESPGPFLSFSSECINFFTQQRSYNHPVVVHCISGVGRTGLFCLIIASILDIQAGKGIPDLVALAGRMCQYRKSCLRDREHLKFAYQAVLYYCQDFLMKRGILTNRPTFEDKKSKEGKCHTRHPSEDFLVNPTSDTAQVQAGMERLDLEPRGKKQESESKNVIGSGRCQSACSSLSHTSSGRSSPSSLPPDILTTLDSINFSLKIDPSDKSQKKKKFTPEDFNKNSTIDSASSSSNDPLNRLDPLWTIKK